MKYINTLINKGIRRITKMARAKLSMDQIRSIRSELVAGVTVKALAVKYNVSEATVRGYTRAERKRLNGCA